MAGMAFRVRAGTDVDMRASGNVFLSASTTATVQAAATLVLKGSLVQIN